MSSSKSHLDGGEFDHLVAYSLAWTFENEVVSAKNYESICFGSLDQVMNDDELVCLNEGKEAFMKGFKLCLDQGNDQGDHCSTKAACGTKIREL